MSITSAFPCPVCHSVDWQSCISSRAPSFFSWAPSFSLRALSTRRINMGKRGSSIEALVIPLIARLRENFSSSSPKLVYFHIDFNQTELPHCRLYVLLYSFNDNWIWNMNLNAFNCREDAFRERRRHRDCYIWPQRDTFYIRSNSRMFVSTINIT